MDEPHQTIARFERLSQLSRDMSSSDFDLNDTFDGEVPPKLTEAAVLVPMVRRTDGWSMILTMRTSALRHHPGQIAFPGGKRDAGDVSLEATALREAGEEIGLSADAVQVLGPAGLHDTVTGFRVTPILGIVDAAFVPKPDPGEVQAVFDVPLSHVFDPRNTRIEGRIWKGRFRKYYTMPYGPHYIWGATARMIVGLQSLWANTA